MSVESEAIQKIAEMTRAGLEVKQIDQYTLLYRTADGEAKTIKLDRKPATNLHYSIKDLFADTYTQDNYWSIYYSRRGIRGFNGESRRSSNTMRLTKSPAFAQLCDWDAKPVQLKQDEFVHLLKTKFRRCCDETLERIIRTLKWTIGNTGESTVKHGGVSMNKSIIAEMSGADDLNRIEYITFDVPVFLEIPTVTAVIECHLRPIPEQQMFIVTPTGGEIENAYRKAEDAIRNLILACVPKGEDEEGSIPVYHGYADADCIDAPKL